jgi:two-component system, OmpR family, phosphate regulon sensor histidine kinase PhoR
LVATIEQNRKRSSATLRILRLRSEQRQPKAGYERKSFIYGQAHKTGIAMKHTRLVWQLYRSQLLITLLALLGTAWYVTHSLREFQLANTAADLEARARLVEDTVAALIEKGDAAAFRQFCREAGKASSTRLTIIAANGAVLADSDEDPERMENHNDRPEIVAALSGKSVPSLRFSHTLQENMMYVGIPLVSGSKTLGVLRTAIPVTSIDSSLWAILKRILWSCVLVALVVALLALLISRRISRPLEKMRLGAERFAQGDFKQKMREEGSEEIASLAKAMNEMASQLDDRIKTIVRQHKQLAAVFSSMTEGVITVDTDERIIELNRAGGILLEVNPEKVKGKSTLMAIRNTALQLFVTRTLASAGPREGEIDLTSSEGKARHFLAHGIRLEDAAGAVSGALIVINDVTNLRRLESMRRDFVANASHELKSPITSIAGFAETLLDGAIDEPENARNFVEIISKQAKRLHAVIEDLLVLSRIEQDAERQEIRLQPSPLALPLQTAVQSCAGEAGEKKTTVSLECNEHLIADINPTLMEQALTNLIDNAIKYSPDGSTVSVAAAQAGEKIRITVTDNGPGIPVGEQARIFERFYRVDKARSNAMGSTGLGLAIVKHIVHAHKGEIEVASDPGKGTSFTILLPVLPG